MSAPIGCAVIAVGGDRDERAVLHAERIVEQLRGLLFPAIGPRAMLARAAAGVQHRLLVFALPADTQAIDIALQKLVLPQLDDLVAQLGHGR